ncbi:aminotransferase class V-fold PLP-dependent enzyme [Mucilaginibacter psychrotolerans]|uniref:Aminotransferase class V-fold PLP-dependent enzyme n=1 Tax=Mucilaginibacter psychrotolerans TaxID=1524096 RepID=A0A4Y8SQ76_9SPHI|nr:aminotransferase class V-fold PLP-dependent enzyme [Mucilaginibacter psychrotolerans]TFF40614.1 aminotransferase class V-fold PLP-dependent enzyme [Mucilaginibacter psychrotolerans]
MTTTILSPAEIQQHRAETNGTAKVIHFNNAGSSLPPDVVTNTVIAYLQEEATYGGYETEAKYQRQLDNTYDLIARLINAHRDEVAIVESASVGWGLVFNGIDFKPGDEIITSEMEYVTNLMGFLNAKKNHDVIFKVVPNDDEGNFSMQGLEDAITPKTKLIAITQVPSTAGGMIPVAEIGKVARAHGILYLVDACQSAGQLPVDVEEIGCDMLSVTGRKYLRAPRGTGFLYVRKTVQDQLKLILIDSHSADWVSETEFKPRNDARRFELYEKNRGLTLGLGKAIEYALNIGIDRIWKRIQYLADTMRNSLRQIGGVNVHDFGPEQCGIVTFSVAELDGAAVKSKLKEQGINVSLAKAISTLIYMNKNHLEGIVRASVHYYNTEEEIEAMCEVLRSMLSALTD